MYSAGVGWDDAKKIGFLPLFLGSVAKQWHKTFCSTNPSDSKKYPETKKALFDAFSRDGKDKMKAKAKLRNRKQGETESVDAYVYSCLELIDRIDKSMNEDEKVKKIIRGLNNFYFHNTYTKEKDLKTVALLLSHLYELEDAPAVYGRETRSFPSTMAPPPEDKKIDDLSSKMAEMLKSMADLKINNVQQQSTSRPPNQRYNSPSRSQNGGHNGRSNSPGRRYDARARSPAPPADFRGTPSRTKTANLFVIVVVASAMSLLSAKSLHSACDVKLWVISLKPAPVSITSQNIWSERRGEISHQAVQAKNAKFDLQIQKTRTGVPTGRPQD
jgi:hypothetical protein